MKFEIMYYLTLACPTVEDTLRKIDEYVAHGVDNFQLDMPSNDPFGETDFVKEMMKGALQQNTDYNYYMDVLLGIRKKYPSIKLSIVVYADVIDAIGCDRYVAFLKELGTANNMIAGDMPEARKAMEEMGVTCTYFITYNDPEYDIERLLLLNLNKENIITMRTKRRTDSLNRRYDTWDKRVKLVHDSGIKASLYAVAEIFSKKDMLERKNAGLDGAIVGNSLMQLWDDEPALWILLNEFQSVVE